MNLRRPTTIYKKKISKHQDRLIQYIVMDLWAWVSYHISMIRILNQKNKNFKYGEFDPKFTNVAELAWFIKKLRTRGSPGIDKITNKIIKNLPSSFHYILVKLFNACLTQSHFPSSWKSAVIIMVYGWKFINFNGQFV